jgi:phosphoribosylpyrophosphate synthetase
MRLLIEGIRYNTESDSFDFDWSKDAPGDLMDLKLKSYNKIFSTKAGNKVYYAYKINKDKKQLKNTLRDSIKYLDTKVNSEDINLMIAKAVASFNQIDPLSSYDLIVTPRSTSPVLELLKNALSAKAGSNTLVSSDMFVKNSIENITYNEEKLNKQTPENRDRIVKALNKVFEKGDWKLRSTQPGHRRFILNFLSFNSAADKRLFNAILGGKVLIVDDILTEGTTLQNMINLLKSRGANETIGFVLLTGK